jgi:TP901 family phage tail tape measure protein
MFKKIGITLSAEDEASPVVNAAAANISSAVQGASGAVASASEATAASAQTAGNVVANSASQAAAATATAASETEASTGRAQMGFKGLFNFLSSKVAIILSLLAAVGTVVSTMVSKIEACIPPLEEFGTAFATASTMMEGSVDDIHAVSNAILQLSSDYGVAAKDIADASYWIASAGMRTKAEVSSALEGVSALARVTGEDMATISSSVVSTMKQWGFAAEESADVANLLFGTVKAGLMDFNDLSAAMEYVGPTARAAGVDIESLTTILAALSVQGIAGSKAGTHLREILVNLSAPAGDAQATLRELGVSMYDAAGNARPLIDVILDLQKTFSGLTEKQKIQAAETIAGHRALSSFFALIETDSESLEEYNGIISNSANLQEALNRVFEQSAVQIEVLDERINTLKIRIGEELAPAVIEAKQDFIALHGGMEAVNEGVKTQSDEIPAVVKEWREFAAVVSEGRAAFYGLYGLMIGLTDGLQVLAADALSPVAEKLGEAQENGNKLKNTLAKLTENTIEWTAALSPLGILLPSIFGSDMLDLVRKFNEEVSETEVKAPIIGLSELKRSLAFQLDDIWALTDEKVNEIVTHVGEIIEGAAGTTLAEKIDSAGKEIQGYIAKSLKEVGVPDEVAERLVNDFISKLKTHGLEVGPAFAGAVQESMTPAILSSLEEIFKSAGTVSDESIDKLMKSLAGKLDVKADWLTEKMSEENKELMKNVKEWLQKNTDLTVEQIDDAMGQIAETIISDANKLTAKVNAEFIALLAESAEKTGSSFQSEFFEKLANALGVGTEYLRGQLPGSTQIILDEIELVLNDSYDFTTGQIDTIMDSLVKEATDQINAGSEEVASSIGDIFKPITDAFSESADNCKSFLQKKLHEVFYEPFDWVSDDIQKAGNITKTALEGIFGTIVNKVAGWVSPVIEKMSESLHGVVEPIEDRVGKIGDTVDESFGEVAKEVESSGSGVGKSIDLSLMDILETLKKPETIEKSIAVKPQVTIDESAIGAADDLIQLKLSNPLVVNKPIIIKPEAEIEMTTVNEVSSEAGSEAGESFVGGSGGFLGEVEESEGKMAFIFSLLFSDILEGGLFFDAGAAAGGAFFDGFLDSSEEKTPDIIDNLENIISEIVTPLSTEVEGPKIGDLFQDAVNEGILSPLEDVAEKVPELFDEGLSDILDMAEETGEILPVKILNPLLESFPDVLAKVTSGFAGLQDILGISGGKKETPESITSLMESIIPLILDVLKFVAGLAQTILPLILSLIGGGGGAAPVAGGGALAAAQVPVAGDTDAVKKVGKALDLPVIYEIRRIPEQIIESTESLLRTSTSIIAEIIKLPMAIPLNMANFVATEVLDIVDRISNIGVSLLEDLKEATLGRLDDFINKARDTFKSVISVPINVVLNTLGFFLDEIQNISEIIGNVGVSLLEGIKSIFTDHLKDTVDNLKGLGKSILALPIDAVLNVVDEVVTRLQDFVTFVSKFFSSILNEIFNYFASYFESFEKFLKGILFAPLEVFKDTFDSLVRNAIEAVNTLTEIVMLFSPFFVMLKILDKAFGEIIDWLDDLLNYLTDALYFPFHRLIAYVEVILNTLLLPLKYFIARAEGFIVTVESRLMPIFMKVLDIIVELQQPILYLIDAFFDSLVSFLDILEPFIKIMVNLLTVICNLLKRINNFTSSFFSNVFGQYHREIPNLPLGGETYVSISPTFHITSTGSPSEVADEVEDRLIGMSRSIFGRRGMYV